MIHSTLLVEEVVICYNIRMKKDMPWHNQRHIFLLTSVHERTKGKLHEYI